MTHTAAGAPRDAKTAIHAPSSRMALMLGALGVVYGDIGTSPLYTLRACLNTIDDLQPAHVLGVLSILFWLLMIVVSLKYVTLVLRADNRGEGGTLALLELAVRGREGRARWLLIVLGIFGAALFYGDSMITPAISVLSALEGISIVSHTLEPWVVPVALVVLVALFAIQSHGTGAVGKLFGPIMALWFATLAVLGGYQIWLTPEVLAALNPVWALRFIAEFPVMSFLLLGAVVLALTGAEALYADMGHFGRPAIRRAWFAMVLPALTLCYFGQGALLLRDPAAIRNPFFLMAPEWGLAALVGLATVATVVASQAVISGAFSVTRQAVQLGFWPRMQILHTSAVEKGQIYLPQVNALLLCAVLVLVLLFRNSENLAAAYGFAVTGTMLTTSVLAFAVLPRDSTGGKRVLWMVLLGALLVIDILLFGANIFKIHEGGWLPLLVGVVVFTLMMTWRRGRRLLADMQARDRQPLREFMTQLEAFPPARVQGTAIFMTMNAGNVPPALLHNLKHNKVLHDHVLFLSIRVADVPYVSEDERFEMHKISASSWQASINYGFKEDPDVPDALRQVAEAYPEIDLEPMRTSFYLSRQTVVAARRPAMARWRRALFAFMARNSTRSTRFFKIPPNRVVEMGMQVEL
ncbi:potassium uptake protein [Bordetella pertussis]|uniref:Probable potassium transport system protein Kup n=8 Tax=Bordetella TaxID=517 RepID=KUP_BORPE|nr:MULTISPECIES: potassium transporter Kup [Bordetella]Q7VTK0.1 RecName: Full=Probable potassium transport system protein Kup [Bordetella pertussis Tohama I]Q7W7H9.1 RecName: Full=Probable potassium transport system protein Kup [Bordetella parapertussis 12822]Q7WKW8.1 RecName: Full=Probable potassium transport system protein Kup [Bordetella bronchiseptica RB50]ETH39633.1 putative potassium uptake protein [Bordetella pertussis H918]ETH42843.1 putative potassium uptake protein [Bordetella pertus